MSAETGLPPARRSLAAYIRALVDGLAVAEPASASRLRQVVGENRALIALDAETVLVRFLGPLLVVEEVKDERPAVEGSGATDRETVLDLLDGRIEVTEAVLSDRLRLAGSTDGIVRISQAMEILIDVAVRAPALQVLADAFRAEASDGRTARVLAGPRWRTSGAAERALLHRLGLLPGQPEKE